MIHADLHIHSAYSSDGEFTPAEITNMCVARGVNLFSLTDHNGVRGIDDAIFYARQAGVDFIPGIEIDCNYEGVDLHVLGYNIDWKSNCFQELEADVSSKVMESFSDMIDNIRKLGFVIDADSVLAKANGKLPCGELIAEVMLSDAKCYSAPLAPYMKGGDRSDMPYINFYLDYFAQGKPAFVPINYMSYKDAIEMIKETGGVPVIAHPGLNLKGRESVVEQLLARGAEGIEVFNNYHSIEQIHYFASVTERRNCAMTCGSDFHGKTKPLINIGQFNLDLQYEDLLKSCLSKVR